MQMAGNTSIWLLVLYKFLICNKHTSDAITVSIPHVCSQLLLNFIIHRCIYVVWIGTGQIWKSRTSATYTLNCVQFSSRWWRWRTATSTAKPCYCHCSQLRFTVRQWPWSHMSVIIDYRHYGKWNRRKCKWRFFSLRRVYSGIHFGELPNATTVTATTTTGK